MIDTLEMVREFHEKFEVETTSISDCRRLRTELLFEEWEELLQACGYIGIQEFGGDIDRVAILDALCDLQYVLDGTFIAFGMDDVKHAAMAEVHRSNMSKLGEDGKPVRREDGKILKGPNFSEPDLKQFIKEESL